MKSPFYYIGQGIQWFYANLWYYTEFLVKDRMQRRPFTFILRDFQHHRPYIFWPIVAGFFFGFYAMTSWNLQAGFFVGGFGFMLLAHLDWGQAYVPHQQEQPPYCPDNGLQESSK
jgi:hypothetical protein